MQKRCLSAGIDVSVIGLGTVKFGRNQGVKYPTAFTLPSDQAIQHLLSVANECGINLLDTAPAYGASEERLGKALRGQRHAWVITTKVGEEFIAGGSHFDFSAAAIQASVERSLRQLGTDYLDMVLVHSNGNDEQIIAENTAFATLAALKQAGKIRAYGMSTKTIAGGLQTVDLADAVMVTLNPTYTDERPVIAHAHAHSKGVLIKKALASGHLPLPASDCLRFALTEPGVTSVIIGTLNEHHLREAAAVASK